MRICYFLLPAFLIILSHTSFCQVSNKMNFEHCRNFEDSCLVIGNKFVDDMKNQEFSGLSDLFADKILFRALVPASIITSNKPDKIAATFQKWFSGEGYANFKVEKANAEMMVDCLHIYYKIYLTYKGKHYNVEQQLFCEVESGKINKLSLICSGFWELNK